MKRASLAPEAIVEAVKANDVKVLALSGVLTLAIDSMKATVERLESEGMRNSVKVLIGGSPVRLIRYTLFARTSGFSGRFLECVH